MKVPIAVLLLAAPVAFGQSLADGARANKPEKEAAQNNAPSMTETEKETSKPTPKASAAAKDALVAIITGNQADHDRAEARLKIESSSDPARNAPLYVSIMNLFMSSEIDDLPSACVRDVNKQLQAGIWSGLPKTCKDAEILVARSSRR
jgi:hypothetical protein